MELYDQIAQAHNALTNYDLELAKSLIEVAEKRILSLDKDIETIKLAAQLGGVMIDLGSWIKDIEIIKSGTLFVKEMVSVFPEKNLAIGHLYNLANGYAAMRELVHKQAFEEGRIPEEYIHEKNIYRKAIALATKKTLDENEKSLLPDLFTHIGNSLDSMGRPVEALVFYDRALAINPNNPVTLVNKAIILKNLAFNAQGHTHLFILEAKRLIELANANSPHPHIEHYLTSNLEQIQEFIDVHEDEVIPEEYEATKSSSKFHDFLREFSFKHQLYLTPSTLIGQRQYQFFGDPLFISPRTADLKDDDKFNRYITFFNQIKQDFVFARYLLIQSQYQANHAEVIDQDVDYYYPLDYSLYSSYIEMLKVSFRLAVDTLDKIAFFIKDYCGVKSLPTNRTYFRTVWSTNKPPLELRPELKDYKNIYLFGLFDLALDLKKGGYYNFVYEHRNALTHRFLSIHGEAIFTEEKSEHLPKFQLNDFLNETIQVLQILKAAVIYLILFVDEEGKRYVSQGLILPVFSPKVGGVFRWKPIEGDTPKFAKSTQKDSFLDRFLKWIEGFKFMKSG